MCDLCDPSTRDMEIRSCYRKAEDLRSLATYYDALAAGTFDPHTGVEVKTMKVRAKGIIRDLVEEWV